jgi:hypothetical protein
MALRRPRVRIPLGPLCFYKVMTGVVGYLPASRGWCEPGKAPAGRDRLNSSVALIRERTSLVKSNQID